VAAERSNNLTHVIALPGGVMPASLAYEALVEELGGEVDLVAKELEIYAGETPPPDYTLDLEIAGIARTAEEAGFSRFHLVGYSGGGAFSLAFTAANPDRVKSLALLEPAWAGNEGLDPREAAKWREADRIAGLPPEEMPAFMAFQLRDGVEPLPPPPGPPPPWMAVRPAGLKAMIRAFRAAELDPDALRAFDRPVYFALGGRSNPDYYERTAERLSELFADFTIEVFEERHHFDPPHRLEPQRQAASLRSLWARAESRTAG
jgi:pimeloyl-ACP methyl ester carboxylesterase